MKDNLVNVRQDGTGVAHYNTTIDNTATIPTSKRYTVKFLKDESLDEILNILKDIIGFDYQQYEKKIVVTQP
jgi:hypothetical protein